MRNNLLLFLNSLKSLLCKEKVIVESDNPEENIIYRMPCCFHLTVTSSNALWEFINTHTLLGFWTFLQYGKFPKIGHCRF